MRPACTCALLLFACPIQTPTSAQNAASPVTTALQTSLQAMAGPNNVQDVTLSGTAEAIAGSDDETGSFTFRATSAGCSRVDLGLPSGTRSETRQPGDNSPFGSWTNGSGGPYPLAQQNLLAGYDWAFPALILNQMLTTSTMSVTFVGQEGTLLHFTAFQQPTGVSAAVDATVQYLTQFDLWLDATTLLPVQLAFSAHPDSNAGLVIPVQVQFSNYQTLGGISVPTQLQKTINGTVVLNAQIQSVSVNTGLSTSIFSL
jgi:hypothetical protein